LHTPHGITDNASWLRRCAPRALLVLLLGVAIFYPFLFFFRLFYYNIWFLQEKLYPLMVKWGRCDARTTHIYPYKSNNC
jgi:hypothetical protein